MDNYIKEKWNNCLNDLSKEVTSISFDLWIKNLKPFEISGDKLILFASSNSVKQQCQKNHSFLIGQAVENNFDNVNDFKILDQIEAEDYKKNQNFVNTVEDKKIIEKQNMFNSKYTFDNFIVGKSNQFAYAAVKGVAENPGKKYNPLFIYSGVGLGKTHLLHAIGNYIIKNKPELNILYTTCENFTNDYIKTLSSKNESIADFRSKYRNLDILMIDDIQFIANKQGTQEEFFHTFNDLFQNNKQIIISSDRHYKEISNLEQRLSSRFGCGINQDIQSPDFETRLAILKKKVNIESYQIDDNALDFIAENSNTNIREMEGFLSKTIFLSQLTGKSIATQNDAEEAMKEVVKLENEIINPNKIIDAVCNYYSINKKDLLGKKRNKEIVDPRQICIYLITEILGLPLTTIGTIMGGRDHTTIIHARNKIQDSINNNVYLSKCIEDIKNLIYNKIN